MATANFAFMKYGFPLIVGGIEDFEEMKKQFEMDTGEEYDEFLYYLDMQAEYEDACELAEKMNDKLEYHHVDVISGYYTGFQFFVEEKDFDYYDETNFDEESLLQKVNVEKKTILELLENLKDYGFKELVITARFSNGETFYSFVN